MYLYMSNNYASFRRGNRSTQQIEFGNQQKVFANFFLSLGCTLIHFLYYENFNNLENYCIVLKYYDLRLWLATSAANV